MEKNQGSGALTGSHTPSKHCARGRELLAHLTSGETEAQSAYITSPPVFS